MVELSCLFLVRPQVGISVHEREEDYTKSRVELQVMADKVNSEFAPSPDKPVLVLKVSPCCKMLYLASVAPLSPRISCGWVGAYCGRLVLFLSMAILQGQRVIELLSTLSSPSMLTFFFSL